MSISRDITSAARKLTHDFQAKQELFASAGNSFHLLGELARSGFCGIFRSVLWPLAAESLLGNSAAGGVVHFRSRARRPSPRRWCQRNEHAGGRSRGRPNMSPRTILARLIQAGYRNKCMFRAGPSGTARCTFRLKSPSHLVRQSAPSVRSSNLHTKSKSRTLRSQAYATVPKGRHVYFVRHETARDLNTGDVRLPSSTRVIRAHRQQGPPARCSLELWILSFSGCGILRGALSPLAAEEPRGGRDVRFRSRERRPSLLGRRRASEQAHGLQRPEVAEHVSSSNRLVRLGHEDYLMLSGILRTQAEDSVKAPTGDHRSRHAIRQLTSIVRGYGPSRMSGDLELVLT